MLAVYTVHDNQQSHTYNKKGMKDEWAKGEEWNNNKQ